MKKHIIPLSGAALAICAALFAINAKSPGSEAQPPSIGSAPESEITYESRPSAEPQDPAPPDTAPADANARRVEKYVLKSENDKIVLICKYTDGEESKSEVPAIEPDYLTDLDREHLAQGIELDSTEEVYKLIEDYSS